MKKKYLILLFIILLFVGCSEDDNSIDGSGYVKDKTTNEPIAGAEVLLREWVTVSGFGESYWRDLDLERTDQDGYFEFDKRDIQSLDIEVSHGEKFHVDSLEEYTLYLNEWYKYRSREISAETFDDEERVIYLDPHAILYLYLETDDPLIGDDRLMISYPGGGSSLYEGHQPSFKRYLVYGNKEQKLYWTIRRDSIETEHVVDVYIPSFTKGEYTIHY